jgi:hypothetical protein
VFSTSDNSDAQSNGRVYALRWTGEGIKPWLLQLSAPAADCDLRRWPMPAESIRQCDGVIAIVGDSFCGSTLVNCVLGAHPEIFGGSELRWLLETPDEAGCAVCGSACAMWTPEALRRVGQAPKMYDAISRHFGRRVICDASKTPTWFSTALERLDAPVVRVLITKHPLRHVASHLTKTSEPVTRARIDAILAHLRAFHEKVVLNGERRSRRFPARDDAMTCDFLLRYEDFVADPLRRLAPILARVGLWPEFPMLNWSKVPAHHIGGNVAPLVQICNAVHPTSTGREKYRQRGIFLDQTYREALEPDAIDYICAHQDARWLLDRFYPGAEARRLAA